MYKNGFGINLQWMRCHKTIPNLSTCPHIFSTSQSENQLFFNILLTWSENLWLVFNQVDFAQISIILFLFPLSLKITVKYIFVVLFCPFFRRSLLIELVTLVVACEPEIRTTNIWRTQRVLRVDYQGST